MNEILVKEINQQNFLVTVSGKSTTTHEVSVASDYAQKLTLGKITTAALIEKSFEFLLDREPNTSILRRFDLTVIAHYFPEYPQEITNRIL